LIFQIAITGEKQIKFPFSHFKKLPILKTTPTLLLRGLERMSAEKPHEL